MQITRQITPCLWFHDQAEEAVRFYVGIFPDSRIIGSSRYGEAGHEVHGRPAGSVMTVEFELQGQRFTALNGGPAFDFNPAVSFQVNCDTQEEIDRYWDALSAGGDERAQQCGWLSDRYGLAWQIVPTFYQEIVDDPDLERWDRVMEATLGMKKIDVAALKRAYDGSA